jgi:Domain of unknown function (DUF4388)
MKQSHETTIPIMTYYNKYMATRLSKLGSAYSTGVLPITGSATGAVYFNNGRITGAESSLTPNLAAGHSHGLAHLIKISEATMDAALALLSSRSAGSRFRAGMQPPAGATLSITVEDLLAEVSRRRGLLSQMRGFTGDTAVTRNYDLSLHRVQVSAQEWALIIRVRPGTTPRELAWALGRSVFATTADVYRLANLGLVTIADQGVPARGPGEPGPGPLSFIRALIGQAEPRWPGGA